ncbi:unnamed protein product [Allacma fusca]|uniref:Uncharacterized protein n=1 Tax=Allacma fusca TaxID=39272 RepID=A0A8J2LFQ7_9HEXA|nr:unnamed protein product [Allacma fusca]
MQMSESMHASLVGDHTVGGSFAYGTLVPGNGITYAHEPIIASTTLVAHLHMEHQVQGMAFHMQVNQSLLRFCSRTFHMQTIDGMHASFVVNTLAAMIGSLPVHMQMSPTKQANRLNVLVVGNGINRFVTAHHPSVIDKTSTVKHAPQGPSSNVRNEA